MVGGGTSVGGRSSSGGREVSKRIRGDGVPGDGLLVPAIDDLDRRGLRELGRARSAALVGVAGVWTNISSSSFVPGVILSQSKLKGGGVVGQGLPKSLSGLG